MAVAKLYSVGLGAGSAEFITLGAVKAIEKADVIAVPRKRGYGKSTALEIVRKQDAFDDSKVIYLDFEMTGEAADRTKLREAAAKRITGALAENKTVAMLTLGDVSIYSTCSYIHNAVKEAGYEYEIIPGVSSFCAAADRAGISICEGNETFAVIPYTKNEVIEKYIDDFDTLIIMKAGKGIGCIYKLLEKYGLENNAVVCSNIGMENEDVKRIQPDDSVGYFTTVIIKKHMEF